MKVPSKSSIISAELWLGLKVATILSKRSALISSSPSRRYDITCSGRPFMSFRESILYGFLWQSQVLYTQDWLIAPYCCPIWHDLRTPEGHQGPSPRRLFSSSFSFRNLKATWRYFGWSYRSQHNFKRWCMTVVLLWCIKNQTKGPNCRRSGGCIYLTWESHPPLCILTCSNNVAEYNTLLISTQLAQQMGVRYLEAYSDSKLIINQVKGEYWKYT